MAVEILRRLKVSAMTSSARWLTPSMCNHNAWARLVGDAGAGSPGPADPGRRRSRRARHVEMCQLCNKISGATTTVAEADELRVPSKQARSGCGQPHHGSRRENPRSPERQRRRAASPLPDTCTDGGRTARRSQPTAPAATWPRNSAGPSGSELSHSVAPANEGICTRSNRVMASAATAARRGARRRTAPEPPRRRSARRDRSRCSGRGWGTPARSSSAERRRRRRGRRSRPPESRRS